MLVTVNTDASFHPDHKLGAFAFWIVCNQGRILQSGPLKEANNSTDAEIRCIANALQVLLQSKFTGISKIIINSDALHAFQKIDKKAAANTPENKCYHLLKAIREKHGIASKQIHEFRHVKAHSGTKEARKWVNDWCDKRAKQHLREMINK